MISSLTGFGRSSVTDTDGRISAELKSVNNRFLQLDVHLPYNYNWADAYIRKYINTRVSRGKVFFRLEVVDYNPSIELLINRPVVDKLLALGSELSRSQGQDMSFSLDGLLSVPGVMKVDNSMSEDTDKQWQRIKPVVEDAVEQFVTFRLTEGKNIADDIHSNVVELDNLLKCIADRLPEFKKQFIDKFKTRIAELAQCADVDEARLNTEIAIWVDKTDVSEEISRLKSHLQELSKLNSSNKPVGRRMDFLLQELNREANTLGNKVSDVEISQKILDIKCCLEKIREQAQNIE